MIASRWQDDTVETASPAAWMYASAVSSRREYGLMPRYHGMRCDAHLFVGILASAAPCPRPTPPSESSQ
eukprot:1994388-Prymnesium_polylepis.2